MNHTQHENRPAFRIVRSLLRPHVLSLLAISLILTAALVLALRPTISVAAPAAQDSSDLILVGLEPDAQAADLAALFAAAGFELVDFWPEFDLATVRPLAGVAVRSADTLLQSAETAPLIRYVEPDGRIEAAVVGASPWTVPDDPGYAEQWALPRIRMEEGWNLTQGSPTVVVAVIDSGVEITHEDLGEGVMWPNLVEVNGQTGVDDDNNGYVDDIHGWDWVEDDASPIDLFGHGTHVAGTMAAVTNNGVGVAGMASNMRVLPLRVLDARGSGFITDLVAALDYARAQGARVVNLSLILRFDSASLHDVLIRLYAEDILVVAATGNYGNQVYWPAVYTETLAVAAVNPDDARASFSNYGPQTDVAAPGENVLSTYKNNDYYENSGTSMATPHVSALAALIWSLRPDLARDDVIELIEQTAVDVNSAEHPGVDDFLGYGRINVAAALQQAATALNLDVRLPVGSYLSVGQPMQIPVRVTVTSTTGSALPVTGAVVAAEIVSATADAAGIRAQLAVQRFYSDEAGYVLGSLTLPAEPGDYLLRVSLGAQEKTLPLRVQSSPLALTLQPATTTVEVGSNNVVALNLAARIESGELYTEPIALSLRTNLGHFADGSQQRSLLITGGMITETFFAGTVAGIADLTLEMPGRSQQIAILVTPSVPYRLVGPERLVGLNFGSGATLEIPLKIYDQYGNQVWATYPINFYSTGGVFSPESAQAINGEVTVLFSMGPWVRGPQPIWAMIPGTFAVYRVDAEMLSNPLYIPQIHLNAEN